MRASPTIRYVQHKDIDKILWDDLINESDNGLVYASSVYLDHMSEGWDALILGNYEAVMPLTWRKKYGVCYLYQPFLTAQLGVFGTGLSAQTLQYFLEAIPKKFRLIEVSLNYKNLFDLQGFNIYKRTNYVLDLRNPYEQIYQKYRENIKRNIKKSSQFDSYIKTGIPVSNITEIAKQQDDSIKDTDLDNFINLFRIFENNQAGKTYGVFSKQNELLASAAFLFSHNRAYYILVGNHPNGRSLGASHALIDGFIRDHAGSNILLDFEGSDLRNLAFFYSSFGATLEPFAAMRLNRLPWYLKWLKK